MCVWFLSTCWFFNFSCIIIALFNCTHTYLPLQLIYDFKDGGGSFGLISLHPDNIPEEDQSKFLKIGVEIPSMT